MMTIRRLWVVIFIAVASLTLTIMWSKLPEYSPLMLLPEEFWISLYEQTYKIGCCEKAIIALFMRFLIAFLLVSSLTFLASTLKKKLFL